MRTFSVLLLAGLASVLSFARKAQPSYAKAVKECLRFGLTVKPPLNLQVGCPDTPLTFWGPCWTDVVIDAASRWHGPDTSFRFLIRSPSVSANPCEIDEFRTIAFRATVCEPKRPSFGSFTCRDVFSRQSSDGRVRRCRYRL